VIAAFSMVFHFLHRKQKLRFGGEFIQSSSPMLFEHFRNYSAKCTLF